MFLPEPEGPAQAGGSRSRPIFCDCLTSRPSCARFCCLRRTRFSRNALASLASRAALSTFFFGVILGSSLISRCNERAEKLSRGRWLSVADSRQPAADKKTGNRERTPEVSDACFIIEHRISRLAINLRNLGTTNSASGINENRSAMREGTTESSPRLSRSHGTPTRHCSLGRRASVGRAGSRPDARAADLASRGALV